MSSESPAPCTAMQGAAHLLPFEAQPDGGWRLRFRAEAGLHQFSVIADARDFDRQELYYPLDRFGNKGQITGPWDFNILDGNRPLLPSYWVALNGERIGLWFFQRVSLEDLAHKRFRGRMAFHLPQEGEATLTFTPYRPLRVRWISARLEPDPEDRLEPQALDMAPEKSAAAPWGNAVYWREMRLRLETTHRRYEEPLRRAFDWVCGKSWLRPQDLSLLLAAWRLDGRQDALNQALRVVDETLALPHWGNPKEDGYSHDGDITPAWIMKEMSVVHAALAAELGTERRLRLEEKLRLQGGRFLRQALLNRDYWGGSLVQDHGWRSMFLFGTAALHLAGTLPEAGEWLAYIVPRVRRGLRAMPRDGAIPPSSYGSPALYLDHLVPYRDALLSRGGEDIFDAHPLREIVDYLCAVYIESKGQIVASGTESPWFIGGEAFLNRIASKFGDGRAAFLQSRTQSTLPSLQSAFQSQYEEALYQGTLAGFLSFDPGVQPAHPSVPPLTFFEDSGLAHYRDDTKGVVLSVRCGPWNGYNAYRRAQGPCDRMENVPAAGHFILHLDAQPRLVNPAIGYRMHTFMRSALLIDNQGQYGDIGYPMSIPSKEHRGEEIESAAWDAASGTGVIRLKLGPAYPESLGVLRYCREFLLQADRAIICRDHILLDRPRTLSWLFQGSREIGIALDADGQSGIFGNEPALRLLPRPAGTLALKAVIRETDIVWSYSSDGARQPIDHLRYDTAQPVSEAAVDFLLTW